jgi:hypothetical protein
MSNDGGVIVIVWPDDDDGNTERFASDLPVGLLFVTTDIDAGSTTAGVSKDRRFLRTGTEDDAVEPGDVDALAPANIPDDDDVAAAGAS